MTVSMAGSVPGLTVRAGLTGSLNEIDPRKAVDYVSGLVLGQIFEPPYEARFGEDGVKPLLFERLRAEDSQHRQFSTGIVPGILFSDGTPLTADLAARSLHMTSALTASRVSIDVRGDRLWFTLASSNPRFELALTHGACSIVLDKGMQLHGTGPFMFAQRPNLRLLKTMPAVRLVRNPHFHGRSKIQEVEFHVFHPEADGSPRSLVDALREGRIDVTTALSMADLSTWQLTGIVPVTRPANSTALLFFNTERGSLKSSAARRGIAMTLDHYAIASLLYTRNAAAFIANSLLPPAMASGGASLLSRTDAPRLIAESGLAGTELTLVVPWAPRPYLTKPLPVAELIRTQLAGAGIRLKVIDTKTSEEFFETLGAGRFDLALGGWIADTPDPADFFEALLSSRVIGSEGHSNYSRWRHPATDAALERFRNDPSDTNRLAIDALVRSEMPLLPLVFGQSSALHSRRLRDVTITATGLLPLADVSIAAPREAVALA